MALTAAPPLPRRGGSYGKDHIGNIDRQDKQDKQDEKLLHGKLTLNATGIEVGLLINFGKPKLEFKRLTRSNTDAQDYKTADP